MMGSIFIFIFISPLLYFLHDRTNLRNIRNRLKFITISKDRSDVRDERRKHPAAPGHAEEFVKIILPPHVEYVRVCAALRLCHFGVMQVVVELDRRLVRHDQERMESKHRKHREPHHNRKQDREGKPFTVDAELFAVLQSWGEQYGGC